jgi:hypothetical protein
MGVTNAKKASAYTGSEIALSGGFTEKKEGDFRRVPLTPSSFIAQSPVV